MNHCWWPQESLTLSSGLDCYKALQVDNKVLALRRYYSSPFTMNRIKLNLWCLVFSYSNQLFGKEIIWQIHEEILHNCQQALLCFVQSPYIPNIIHHAVSSFLDCIIFTSFLSQQMIIEKHKSNYCFLCKRFLRLFAHKSSNNGANSTHYWKRIYLWDSFMCWSLQCVLGF